MSFYSNIPRPEHPNPQFFRKNWVNLNGKWDFEMDPSGTGVDRGLIDGKAYSREIQVPFCMESELSGLNFKDFCKCVWYHRVVDIPEDFLCTEKQVVLHIGASDYRTTVYVNGRKVGYHIGGYVSFSFDITDFLNKESSRCDIVICAEDDNRSRKQASGKQSLEYHSKGCYYTRTTGIWQTVWLESVPKAHISSIRCLPNLAEQTLTVEARAANANGKKLKAYAYWDGQLVGASECFVCGEQGVFIMQLSQLHLWEIGSGGLYDLRLELEDDCVSSYFGMREVRAENGVFYLNGKPVFQRLVLDQGFYPEGIYTAPSEADLIADIRRSMDMGFNGARLHEKIFEQRFLYYCDRMGYMVWEEHANWGLDLSSGDAWKGFIPEWNEIVLRDFNHPAIVGWCPLNEVQFDRDEDFIRYVSTFTKQLDPTRPVIVTSGWNHVNGLNDFEDWHDYDQNPETMRTRYEDVVRGIAVTSNTVLHEPLFPNFISEYGGIRWDIKTQEQNAWGYGVAPKSEQEFKARFKGLADALMDNPHICGFCYTQLTDVEQEVNGLYTYDRKAKFAPEFFKKVLSREAAVEKKQ